MGCRWKKSRCRKHCRELLCAVERTLHRRAIDIGGCGRDDVHQRTTDPHDQADDAERDAEVELLRFGLMLNFGDLPGQLCISRPAALETLEAVLQLAGDLGVMNFDDLLERVDPLVELANLTSW